MQNFGQEDVFPTEGANTRRFLDQHIANSRSKFAKSYAEKPAPRCGKLRVFCGQVSSKKGEYLCKQIPYDLGPLKLTRVVLVYYEKEDKHFAEVIRQFGLTVDIIKSKNLEEISLLFKQYDIIIIDEAHFFPEIVEFSEKSANKGKIVYVVACDGTFKRTPFDRVHELVPLADTFTQLSAECVDCKGEAAYTWRTVDKEQIVLPGGEKKYKPVCRKCYMKLKHQKEKREGKNSSDTESFQTMGRLGMFEHRSQTKNEEELDKVSETVIDSICLAEELGGIELGSV